MRFLPARRSPLAARCKLGEACQQLESFINEGGRKWRSLPREPSRERFERLFNSQ
jgi:hypothetical protein